MDEAASSIAGHFVGALSRCLGSGSVFCGSVFPPYAENFPKQVARAKPLPGLWVDSGTPINFLEDC